MQGVCFNCFHYAPEGQPCPYCGYDAAGDAGKYRLALQPGTILANRYLVGRVLGQGGFGITYVALDNATKSRVAIKEYMPTDFAFRDEGTVDLKLNSSEAKEDYEFGKQQFLAEAETLAEFVGNEHIIAIRDRFEANGTAYFAMEYAEGVDLKRYMEQKGGPLRICEANRILLPIMEALQWVHSKGIVHRDISPDNIMIRRDGNAKLIDFGAARYSTGEKSKSLDVVLKHGFAPMEQYSRRGRQGPFTDVYAMAATYYYAITGKVPPDAVDRTAEDELQPPSALGVNINEDTEQVLLKALVLNAQDRWQTMAAFYSALLATMPQPFEPGAGEGTGAAKKPAAQKEKKPEAKTTAQKTAAVETGKPKSKKPATAIAAVLVVAILLGIVFGTGILKKKPAAEQPEPTAEAETIAGETAAASPTESAEEAAAEEAAEEPSKVTALKITAIAVGLHHTVALREDGTVAAVGENSSGECNVSDWRDVVAIAARGDGTYGICRDGTVLATGGGAPYRVDGWKDITILAPGSFHVVGIKPDGTAVAGGGNMDGQCDVSKWKDIIDAACGAWCSVGLKKDGTAVAAGTIYGYTGSGENRTPIGDDQEAFREIATWKNLVSVHARTQAVYGISSDGSIHAVGIQNSWAWRDWTDIVSLTGTASLAGLKSDGTVVAEDAVDGSFLQRDVEDWTDIVAIAAGDGHLVGLKSDGTVVAVGKNNYGQCDLEELSRKYDTEETVTEISRDTEKGNTVVFGNYEQDNDTGNGKEPIRWIVLDVQDGSALLLSQNILDCHQYHNSETDIFWEDCSLREWLNNDFYAAAFSTEEMNRIVQTTADNSLEQNYDGFKNTMETAGNPTEDKVFALSYAEAWQYFGADSDRTAQPTAYAQARGCYTDKENGNSWWWLRSPGRFLTNGADVNTDGYLDSDIVDRSDIGVRPAVWIRLD